MNQPTPSDAHQRTAPEPSAADQLLLDALNLVPMCYRKENQEERCLELIAAHVAAEIAKAEAAWWKEYDEHQKLDAETFAKYETELATARAALAQCEERLKEVEFVRDHFAGVIETQKIAIQQHAAGWTAAEAKLAQCEGKLAKERDCIVALRTALNGIAHPVTYKTEHIDPRRIAQNALVMGLRVVPLTNTEATIADLTAQLASATQQSASAEADRKRLKEVLHKIAYEPFGPSDASLQEVYDSIVECAIAAIQAPPTTEPTAK